MMKVKHSTSKRFSVSTSVSVVDFVAFVEGNNLGLTGANLQDNSKAMSVNERGCHKEEPTVIDESDEEERLEYAGLPPSEEASSPDTEDKIATFMAVMNMTDAFRAKSLLAMFQNNLQMAVSYFLRRV